MNLGNILKGIGGEPEIIRTSGIFTLVAYVLSVVGFTWWMLHRGEKFDVVAYCAAFSGGAVVIFGAIAGGVALKDRNVASAKVTEAQGAPAQEVV